MKMKTKRRRQEQTPAARHTPLAAMPFSSINPHPAGRATATPGAGLAQPRPTREFRGAARRQRPQNARTARKSLRKLASSHESLASANLPRLCCCGKQCVAGPGGKADTPERSSGPAWEIQEVSRVGAQGVTSKSKLWSLGVHGHVLSTSNAFEKCFGSGECQGAAETGKSPRVCHLLRLGQVADPTTATVRTGRSSTAGIRDFQTEKSLQIAHFG